MTRWRIACGAVVLAAVGCGSEDMPLTPAVPPATAQVAQIGDEITEPVKIKHVVPEYPAEARQKRISGVVILEALIDATGRVATVRVIQFVDPLLDNAAIEAVRQWEYTPGRVNGQPVPVIMTVTVNFVLQ